MKILLATSGVLAIALALFAGTILPHVENPWPQSIGLGFPFAVAGAGGVLAGMIYAEAPEAERDRAIRSAGLATFRIGMAFYLISLLVQISSGI